MGRHRGFSAYLLALLAVVGICWSVAVAQPPARMSGETASTAWDLEAKALARQLNLNEEKTAKLVDAYKSARTSQREAVQAKLGEGGERGREAYQAMREVSAAERTKLEACLKEFLTPEETAKAMPVLGSFNRRFDQLTVVLDAMKLETETYDKAMQALMAYVAETSTIMNEAGPETDREALRDKMQQAREKMDADMAKILPSEQLAKWREASSRRRGR